MPDAVLLHDLPALSALRSPEAIALTYGGTHTDYAALQTAIEQFASGLLNVGVDRAARVAVFLEKRVENVVACFGSAAAGAVFVPLNPLLKPEQVGHILRDCNVRVIVTSSERLALIADTLGQCPDLRCVVLIGDGTTPDTGHLRNLAVIAWNDLLDAPARRPHRVIDTDMLSILYTSGSTGKPKGVVLSHRNMVAGAKSVATYLENSAQDVIVSALPLSFDAGFSQLTTAFHVGARVVLVNYLLPRDVIRAMERESATGLTAVPPLWIQLTQLDWPATVGERLRYFANTGGRMPFETLKALRARAPKAKPYLMYGLTEAFRSTYLPPEQVDTRPDSIGKAIPNAEILVLREDGSECAPNEPGELVHRGALVSMGYWNDPDKTAERFKPLPHGVGGRESGLVIPELAVYSGDTVRRDADGFLYFIGRRDEMIKTSGYRVSPTEVEEVLYNTQLVGESAVFGVDHDTLGQAIVAIVTAKPGGTVDRDELLALCRAQLPAYMVPAVVDVRSGPLPRNANGKIDRPTLAREYRADAQVAVR